MEFLLVMEGVEKALLLNSLIPSLMILRELSFLMWIVSLKVLDWINWKMDKIKCSLKRELHRIFNLYSLSSPNCVDNCKL